MPRIRGRKKKQSSASSSDSEATSPIPRKKTKRSVEAEAEEELSTGASTSRSRETSRASGALRNSSGASSISPSSILICNQSERAGKIASMRLQNFMCHTNLYVEFGPNINFLVGSNGSGKSAVLTALALGLASSARATNRAHSIQKLIKNGETNATIELSLHNSGTRPFKRDIYGPQITVVRQIRQSSSQYQLKDARGNVVSKKLDDIRRILLFFGIRVENPVFVLNQDAAREFLKDLEPTSNFTLLMKATQLDVCSSSLNSCHDQRMSFNYEMNLLNEKNLATEKLCKKEENNLKVIQNKESLKTRLQQAEVEKAWLVVKQQQNDLRELEESIEIIETKKSKLEQSTSAKECEQQSLSQQLSQLSASKSVVTQKYQQQEQILREAKRQVQDFRQSAGNVIANITNIDRRLQEEQHTLTGCQKQLENFNANYANVKKLMDSHAKSLATFEEKIETNQLLIVKLREEQREIKQKIQSANEDVEALKKELNTLLRSTQSISEQISSLSRNKSDKSSVYGDQALRIMQILSTQYANVPIHKRPRGPIGNYITVPDPKYRDLVENQLMSCLRSYIVCSDAERQALRTLFNKNFPAGSIPTIISSSYTERMYNVSKYKVNGPRDTTVLLDVIKCDDPVVMNYLIDVFKIESVLITDSKQIAEFVTSNIENVPPNLKCVLVPNLGLEYIPAPKFAMYANRVNAARYIQVNVDDRIKQLQEEQRDLEERQTIIQTRLEESVYNRNQSISEDKMTNATIKERQTENQNVLKQKMEIQNYEYQEMPAVDVLQKHLDTAIAHIDKLNKERNDLQVKLKEIDKRKDEAEIYEASEYNALKEIQQEARAIDEKSHKKESEIRSFDAHHHENTVKLAKTLELLERHLKDKRELEREIETEREKAQKVGDFRDTKLNAEQLSESISRYGKQITQYDSLNINAEQVEQKLSTLRDTLKTQTENMELIVNLVKSLRMSYHERAQRFHRSRNHYFTLVEFQFQNALGIRGFDAALIPNYKAQTLQIDVFPPNANKTSNSRTLSGGERSFSTVSLLKGLWSIADHPFYFLDEYDVFTDEVNRTFITNLLIQEGKEYLNRQYCFLTPQDTEVEASHLITVHKLEPAARG